MTRTANGILSILNAVVLLGRRDDEVSDEEAYCLGEEPENQSVEEHKSVILHLLSQLKLGMDLTKVPSGALPQLHFLQRNSETNVWRHADFKDGLCSRVN